MRSTTRGVVIGIFLMLPIACGEEPGTATELPSPAATVVASHTPSAVPPTHSTATPSATATPVASATATWDPTHSAAVTLEAIRVAVTASGVPEGSTEFEVQVAATRCAVIPPATSTPLPWQLAPEQPYQVSTNCMGSDLPGQDVQVWQEGAWIEAQEFHFANPSDLEGARQSYLAYLDVIGLRAGPPGEAFAMALAEHMDSIGVLPSPQSCLSHEILGWVSTLEQQGLYVRLTFTQPIQWDAVYFLFVSPVEISLALPWSTSSVRQELISTPNDSVVRQEVLSGLAGTARLRFDTPRGQWIVMDDARGYYCHVLPTFVR